MAKTWHLLFWLSVISIIQLCALIESSRLIGIEPPRNSYTSRDTLKMRTYMWPSKIRHKFQAALNSSQMTMMDFRRVYRACMDLRQRIPKFIEDSDYIIDQPKFCTGRRTNTWLLIAVHSHPRNIHRRNVIRSTWGSVNRVGKRKIALIFILGNSGSEELEKSVQEENSLYRDILQRNFTDDYRNLTRKHITLFEWLTEGNCQNLSYLVKVDDDTFVDVFHLVNLLESQPSFFKGGFYCSATRGAKPSRPNGKIQSKWLVDVKEFPGKEYPVYCEGFGYVLDPTVIPLIYWCSIFKPFMWIDDVYVAGILPQLLNIKRNRFFEGHSYARIEPSMEHGALVDFIFLTSYYSEFLPNSFRKLWSASIENSFNIVAN